LTQTPPDAHASGPPRRGNVNFGVNVAPSSVDAPTEKPELSGAHA
jgi:hypothetical protein